MTDGLKRRNRMGFAWLSALVVSLALMGIGVFGFGQGITNRVGVLMICAPIAVASLLFGPMRGLACGLIAGIALSIHGTFQPSTYIGIVGYAAPVYLLSFTLCGLMLDLLVHGLLREGLPKGKRALRMGIVSLACTVLTLLVLTLSAITVDGLYTMHPFDLTLVINSFAQFLLMEGPVAITVEVLVNTAIVFASLLIADGPIRYALQSPSLLPVRMQFRTRLLASVVLAFFATYTIAYVTITNRCERVAAENTKTILELYATYTQSIWDESCQSLEAQGKDADVAQISSQVQKSDSLNTLFEGYRQLEYGTLYAFDKQGNALAQSKPARLGTVNDTYYQTALVEYLEELASLSELKRSATGISFQDFAMSVPVRYIGVVKTDDVYILAEVPSDAVVATRTTALLWLTMAAGVLLATLYVIAARILDTTVTGPIQAIGESMARIGNGEQSERVEVWSSPEFSALSDGINASVDALKDYAAESAQRIERDLLTAKAIQEGALPREFPQVDEFALYASMRAAKEVGGDFYDFFPLGENALGFLIADVSEKGIPAALFMMRAMTEIRSCMQKLPNLEKAIATANDQLRAANPELLFVTVWAARLDYEKGVLTYVNAGHNPPLLRHNGTWRWLDEDGSFVMAAISGMDYQSNSLVLEHGDELLLYTDGVNEAKDINEDLYGNDRLEAFVQEHADLSPRALNDELLQNVVAWSRGTEQSDDITLLVLEYHGAC